MKFRTRSAIIALAGALILAPALTGCGMLEGIIEQASDGQIDVSMGSLPDGWPEEVPVIDGEILVGGSADTDDGTPGWNVTIKVDSESAYEEIAAQLIDAGFEDLQTGDVDGGTEITSGGFKNDNYGVLVAVTGAEGNYVANYTVIEGDPTAE